MGGPGSGRKKGSGYSKKPMTKKQAIKFVKKNPFHKANSWQKSFEERNKK